MCFMVVMKSRIHCSFHVVFVHDIHEHYHVETCADIDEKSHDVTFQPIVPVLLDVNSASSHVHYCHEMIVNASPNSLRFLLSTPNNPFTQHCRCCSVHHGFATHSPFLVDLSQYVLLTACVPADVTGLCAGLVDALSYIAV